MVPGGGAPAGAARPRFRPGRWRAVVLIGVHHLFALHLVHWRVAGETLSPVEPSEGMQLATRGVVNAGAVFFALTLLSTVVLGRWFCGWGCHLVALQDLARALLLRVGITPRPLRSRALLIVPVLAFAYMFGLPFVARPPGAPRGPVSLELTTPAFWETFPGPVMALVTLFVCGALAVLFLGAKGFCTYACPYGAAFSFLDRLAPLRIKVSDACDACGQCTAVCSSNVLVHAEVRDWGMVVDPGCMKCLDCVAHCPTGALSFGWAAPALRKRATPRADPKPRPPAFGWGEEALLAAGFVLAFLAWRGLYRLVPFLLALGLAGILAWTWLVGLRLARRPASQKLLRWHLRREGRLTAAGALFAALTAASLALSAHAGLVQVLDLRAERFLAGTAAIRSGWEQALLAPPALDPVQRAAVEDGLAREQLLGRISLLPDPRVELRLAWLHLLLGDDPACEAAVRAALAGLPDQAPPRCDWAAWLLSRGRAAEAEATLREAAALDLEDQAGARQQLARLLVSQARLPEAEALLGALVARHPREARLHLDLAALHLVARRPARAVDALSRALELEPGLRPARLELAAALVALERHAEALAQYQALLLEAPDDPDLNREAGLAAIGARDARAAEAHLERAVRARPEPASLTALAFLLDRRGERARAAALLEQARALEAGGR